MKKRMSNSKRAIERRNRERKTLFQDAISDGHTSRRDLCKAMGIAGWELTEFFEMNPKMYKLYSSRRRELRDVALDNIQDIVEDPKHKDHYQASKYVVDNYKTDLDIILESKKSDESIEISQNSESDSGIVINFKK